MHYQRSIGAAALGATFCILIGSAMAGDEEKYPNWRGQWYRSVGTPWDPTKRGGLAQQAPLTPEYQAIYEATLAQQRTGSQDYKPQVRCLPSGMPQMMIGYEPMEFVITPDVTYMHMVYMQENRHIYTDGRKWPEQITPTFSGYSIGQWLDTDGDGKYDTLEMETRGFRGPRIIDPTGLPVHADNQTIIKERMHLDEQKPDFIHDEVTLIDHAFTRPWTVTRSFKRQPREAWAEYFCAEHNTIILLGQEPKETYFIREDGYLMPSRKDQPAPDLRFFEAKQ